MPSLCRVQVHARVQVRPCRVQVHARATAVHYASFGHTSFVTEGYSLLEAYWQRCNRFGEKCCSGAGGLIPPLWFVTRQMHNFSCDDGSASILLTEAMLDLLIAVAD